MRYADNWTKVDIQGLDFEAVLTWYAKNLKGKQFLEKNVIKFGFMRMPIYFEKIIKNCYLTYFYTFTDHPLKKLTKSSIR